MGRWGRAAAAAVLAVTATGCWLQPGYDAGRTGWNAGEATLTSANVDGIVELWDAPVAGATSVQPEVSVGGTVYAVGTTEAGGFVVAIDAATGRTRWSHDLSAGEPAHAFEAAHVDGTLVVPYAHLDDTAGGGLLTLDPRTGAVLDDAPVADGSLHHPAMAGGVLALAHHRRPDPADPWRSQARFEWAYDTVWVDHPPSSPFAVVGDRILSARVSHAVGFSPACPAPPATPPGSPPDGCHWDWATDLGPGEISGPVAVGGGRVAYASSNADWARVSVLDVTDGSVEWTWEAPGTQVRAMAVADGRLLVTLTRGDVVALPAGGCGAPACAPLWEGRGGAGLDLTVGGDVAYTTTLDALHAYAVDGCGAAVCAPVAEVPILGPSQTIVDGGRLFVGGPGSLAAHGLPG